MAREGRKFASRRDLRQSRSIAAGCATHIWTCRAIRRRSKGRSTWRSPRPRIPARWSLQLGIKPIQPVFRVRCGQDAGAGGVCRAYLTADSLPPWARIEFGLPEADPEVCSRAPPAFGFRLNAPTLAVAGGVGLLGLLVGILAF